MGLFILAIAILLHLQEESRAKRGNRMVGRTPIGAGKNVSVLRVRAGSRAKKRRQ
jgi:hypothetical protein